MKRLALICLVSLLAFSSVPRAEDACCAGDDAAATCKGSDPCKACKSCASCKHRKKDGGACG